MPMPEGSLSPVQFHILTVIWDHGRRGATVTEVWETVGHDRSVVRSTVQNLMERLAARGWLERRERDGGLRYRATVPRERVERKVSTEVVDGFFSGSAANLVHGLLGAGKLNKEEVEKLRKLLDEADV